MNVYVQLCIADVEEDADIEKIASIVAQQIQSLQPYHTITVDNVEVA